MEEEENKTEPQVEVQTESKKFDLKSIDYKKYLPYAGIALAVIVVIIILVAVLGGGPKKAVKKFISGMNGKNASKVVNSIDVAGMYTWAYSYYDEDDFSDEDYEEFLENYKDVDKDDIKEAKSTLKESMEDSFDDIKDEYKSYKFKIEKFKNVEKIAKNLYAVDAKVSITAKPKDEDETDEIDESETVTFIVYKNKIISFGGISLY